MVERRVLLGTSAVLMGVGSALLAGTAVAAADTGDEAAGQPADTSAAQASRSSAPAQGRRTAAPTDQRSGAPARGAARATSAEADRARTRAPKDTAPAPASAAPAGVSAAAVASEPAPAVTPAESAGPVPAALVAQSVSVAPAAATAAPTPASAATLLAKALAVLGRGPGAPGAVLTPPTAAATAAARGTAEPAAVTGTASTVAAAPPDPGLTVWAGTAALPGYTNGVTGVQIGHSRLGIAGDFIGDTVAADWYFPTQATGAIDAQGVIWLQHGFAATNTFYSALATELAQQTNSIVVAPTLSSLPFTLSGGCLTCASTEQAAASLFGPNRAELLASAQAAGYTAAVLPESFIVTGHSAGAGFATAVAADYLDGADVAYDPTDLKGVVMFDGVSGGAFDGSFTTEVNTLQAAGKAIYQIAAPAQSWNAFGITTNQLVIDSPGEFVGVVLAGGSHVDSMLGVNPLFDLVLQLVTKPVPAGNTAAVYTLSTGWINDLYAGATPQDPEYGFYAGANQPIIMGPTSAIALPTPIANQLDFGDAVLAAIARVIGITIPPNVPPQTPNGVDAVTVPPLSNGVTGVKTGSAVLDIPCGDTGYPAPATWYFPTQADGTVQANGVIWLQHGFLGFDAWYSDMAMALARQTNSIVVAPSIFWFDNPICPGCYLGSPAIREAVAEMFQGDRTALNVSANAAGLQGPLPEKFLLTGHSAGGNLATAVGALITATPEVDNLLGVVMFDGVSRAPLFTDSLAALTAAGIPDYQIAAPPQRWNAYGVATELMTAEYPDRFNGVQIDNGSHTDVIGGDSLFAVLAEIASDFVVKPSPPGAKAAVRTLAAGWINDIYAGNTPYGAVGGQPLYGVYGPLYAAPLPYQPAGYNNPFVMGEAGATTLPAPPPVDLLQYSGKWYEQGSVRQFFSLGLVNTTATYTPLPDGNVKVENFGQYFGPNGPEVNIVGVAVPVNDFKTRLDVGFGGIFGPAQPSGAEPGNYWILDYAPDYSWAIVGDPQGTSGYILTRDQFIPEGEYNVLVQRAYQLGVMRPIIPTRQYPAAAAGEALTGPETLPASVSV